MEKQANSNIFPRWNIHNARWRICYYWSCYNQVSLLIRSINFIIHCSRGSDCGITDPIKTQFQRTFKICLTKAQMINNDFQSFSP